MCVCVGGGGGGGVRVGVSRGPRVQVKVNGVPACRWE